MFAYKSEHHEIHNLSDFTHGCISLRELLRDRALVYTLNQYQMLCLFSKIYGILVETNVLLGFC
jgi:hypothetical protein